MENNSLKNRKHVVFVSILMVITLALFLVLIWDYLIALLLSIIFAGLLSPTYGWFLRKTNGRKVVSSMMTILLFLLIVVVPTLFLFQQIIAQASALSDQLVPILKKELSDPSYKAGTLPEWFPFKEQIAPYSQEIFSKLSHSMEKLSSLVIDTLTSLTQETFIFFINLFIMLYATYYFLISGNRILKKVHNYIPLTDNEFDKIVKRISSVSRATIKGAILIGIIQGALVGLGFWVVGIEGPIFWGSVAAIMSLIPSVGTAIIYVPAGIYLLMSGQIGYGIGLLIWGGAVVSSVDNVLRPILVGKDAKIPDLLILVSTLGGIGIFGISGVIIGPLLAGLLITVAEIYNEAT